MMEAVCTSETSVNFNKTIWRYIPEGYLSSSDIMLLSDSGEKMRVQWYNTTTVYRHEEMVCPLHSPDLANATISCSGN
jgi:hypothetical protein